MTNLYRLADQRAQRRIVSFERRELSRLLSLYSPRVASGEYKNISFIHEIADHSVEDVTEAIISEAALPEIAAPEADLQSARFDHERDLRKHETA